MKCLFIGGHAAGKIIDVDIRQSAIRLAKPMPMPATAEACGDGLSVGYVAECATYKWSCVTGRDGHRISIYVEEDVDCPLIALMDFYASADHAKAIA